MYLALTDTGKQLSDLVILIYTLASSISEFQLLQYFDNPWIVIFPFSFPDGCVIALPCGSSVHFSDGKWSWTVLHMFTGHLNILLFEVFKTSFLYHITFCFIIDLLVFFIYSRHEYVARYMYYDYFLCLCTLLFHSINSTFDDLKLLFINKCNSAKLFVASGFCNTFKNIA